MRRYISTGLQSTAVNSHRLVVAAIIAVTILALPAGIAYAHGESIEIEEHPELGRILTDVGHMTLYRFAEDRYQESHCDQSCSESWEPLTINAGPLVPPSGLPGNLDGFIREDGRRHVTYNGWPLYRYSGDKEPGNVNGHGIDNRWRVARPDDPTAPR